MNESTSSSTTARRSSVRLARRARTGLRWLLVAAIVALLLLPLVGPRVTQSQWIVVAGGSMRPALAVGDIVGVREVPAQDIRPADVITFRDEDGDFVTHRVIGREGGAFVTQGDANGEADRLPVQPEQVVGRIDGPLPASLSVLLRASDQWAGRLALAGAFLLLVLVPTRPTTAGRQRPTAP